MQGGDLLNPDQLMNLAAPGAPEAAPSAVASAKRLLFLIPFLHLLPLPAMPDISEAKFCFKQLARVRDPRRPARAKAPVEAGRAERLRAAGCAEGGSGRWLPRRPPGPALTSGSGSQAVEGPGMWPWAAEMRVQHGPPEPSPCLSPRSPPSGPELPRP